MEDFNGEKADRYLCEAIPEVDVIRMLDFAKAWLLSKQGELNIYMLYNSNNCRV
jgi:hypothetical protein